LATEGQPDPFRGICAEGGPASEALRLGDSSAAAECDAPGALKVREAEVNAIRIAEGNSQLSAPGATRPSAAPKHSAGQDCG